MKIVRSYRLDLLLLLLVVMAMGVLIGAVLASVGVPHAEAKYLSLAVSDVGMICLVFLNRPFGSQADRWIGIWCYSASVLAAMLLTAVGFQSGFLPPLDLPGQSLMLAPLLGGAVVGVAEVLYRIVTSLRSFPRGRVKRGTRRR